jgi:hypothetical protein
MRGTYRGHPQYEQATFGGNDERKRRQNMEGMLTSFHALGARPDLQIKVRECLKRLFKRDLILEWDAGNLKAKFARLVGSKESKLLQRTLFIRGHEGV